MTQITDLDCPAFVWPIRVYYEDTDSVGLVYYANYLRYLERARTEWLRALGFDQTDVVQQWGVVFVVRSVTIDYLSPARFNDSLRVSVQPQAYGASQLRFKQQVCRDHRVLVEAQVSVVCVNGTSLKPVRLPRPLLERIHADGSLRTPNA